MKAEYHAPVLCSAAVRALLVDTAGIYVDGTVGGGGHAEEICRRLTNGGRLIGFDLDEDAHRFSSARLAPYGGRIALVRANFREIRQELHRLGINCADGVLLDLGMSSFQIDEGSKGFSFRTDDALDMRMDRRQSLSAREVVNSYAETALADILYRYGEERNSRRIAKRIVAQRPLSTTGALSAAVEAAVGQRFLLKTLARVFQALRIEVNHELDNLAAALAGACAILKPGGRIVVISYHSLEDRMVKEFYRKESAGVIPSGHKLIPDIVRKPALRVLTQRPVRPLPEEIRCNPRARSAKMRVAERTTVSCTGDQPEGR